MRELAKTAGESGSFRRTYRRKLLHSPLPNCAAIEFSESRIAELKEAFSLFDDNANGSIEIKELGVILRALGLVRCCCRVDLMSGNNELSQLLFRTLQKTSLNASWLLMMKMETDNLISQSFYV